jgi:ketosteroid isomerase-like protein
MDDGAAGERERVLEAAVAVADAIAARDQARLRTLLSRDFIHRQAGAGSSDADTFLSALARIPGEILSVQLARVEIDMAGDSALVTGLQNARVRLDGELIEDTRPFVDWMVKEAGAWRVRAAVELPQAEGQ